MYIYRSQWEHHLNACPAFEIRLNVLWFLNRRLDYFCVYFETYFDAQFVAMPGRVYQCLVGVIKSQMS